MAIKELKSVDLGKENFGGSAIIGTFEGECADGLATNANNMDIPVEVWTTLFNSDEYKQAIELGWYIGFLGHPDDPDCMDFKDACIVMTEGHIDSDGKVYGKFNLIDTPVGRIVKSFIDAGVTFGISVRGVGETTSNGTTEVVDADSFVFRGFDLVAFPAFENAIPEFQALAASSKAENRVKYKKICASIDSNLPEITSPTAIDTIKEQFSPNSEQYAILESRKSELLYGEPVSVESQLETLQKKFDGLYRLYQEAQDKIAELGGTVDDCNLLVDDLMIEGDYSDKRMSIFESIIANQNKQLKKIQAQQNAKHKALITANAKIKDENERLVEANKKLSGKNKKLIQSNRQLKEENSNLGEITAHQQTKIDELSKNNLKYNREVNSITKKIESATRTISAQEQEIASLNSKLDETVTRQRIEASKSSNRDDENQRLRQELVSVREILAGYQSAYVDLYQSASGMDLSNLKVTASTSINELHNVIKQQSGVPIMASTEIEPSIIFEGINDTDGMVIL